MAQLVERLLPIPEVRSSNPVIGKNYINIEHKEKEAGNGLILIKKTFSQ